MCRSGKQILLKSGSLQVNEEHVVLPDSHTREGPVSQNTTSRYQHKKMNELRQRIPATIHLQHNHKL